jgi:hypothetical protein
MAVGHFVRAFREHGTLRDKLDDARVRKLFTDTVVGPCRLTIKTHVESAYGFSASNYNMTKRFQTLL